MALSKEIISTLPTDGQPYKFDGARWVENTNDTASVEYRVRNGVVQRQEPIIADNCYTGERRQWEVLA